MSNVVRNLGRRTEARGVDGDLVQRKDVIFMKTYNANIPVMNTDNHFVYQTRRLGSSTKCTCGADAVIMGYEAYNKYHSEFIGNEVLMCYKFFQFGFHADGSH